MNAIHHITIVLNAEDLCMIRLANPGVEIVKNQEKGLCPDCRQSGHGYILIYKSRKLRSFTNIIF